MSNLKHSEERSPSNTFRDGIFLLAIFLVSIIPFEDDIEKASGLDYAREDEDSPMEVLVIICSLQFIYALTYGYGFRAACVLGLGSMTLWTLSLPLTVARDSEPLQSFALAFRGYITISKLYPFVMLGLRYKSRWAQPRSICFLLFITVSMLLSRLGASFLPKMIPLTIFTSALAMYLFYVAIPTTTVIRPQLTFQDLASLSGFLIVIAVYAYLSHRNYASDSTDVYSFSASFLICIVYMIICSRNIVRWKDEIIRREEVPSLDEAEQKSRRETDLESLLGASV